MHLSQTYKKRHLINFIVTKREINILNPVVPIASDGGQINILNPVVPITSDGGQINILNPVVPIASDGG